MEGSLRRGAPTKGPPRHQNKFAFKHNKNSKKTRIIKQIVHDGLCRRCHEKVEWRKKYRKYKPLSAPAHCNGCKQKAVKRAYHTLCDSCAGGRGVCAKCAIKLSEQDKAGAEDQQDDMDEDDEEVVEAVPSQSESKPNRTAASSVKDEDNKPDAESEGDEDMSFDDDEDEEEDEDEDDEE